MSFLNFQEIIRECSLTRTEVERVYNENPLEPWSPQEEQYNLTQREIDADKILDMAFFEDPELSLNEVCSPVNSTREQLREKKIEGDIWSTIGNLRVAIALTAAEEFRNLLSISDLIDTFDWDDVVERLPRSPYGDLRFPAFEQDEYGKLRSSEKTLSADEVAAGQMYRNDMIALLIARHEKFEECMP